MHGAQSVLPVTPAGENMSIFYGTRSHVLPSTMPRISSRIDQLTFVLVLGIVVAAAIAFWPLLDVIILSLSLAVVILPVQRFFSRYMNDALAAGLTTALVIIVIAVSVGFTIAVIVQNADYINEIVNTILSWIRSPPGDPSAGALPISSDQIANIVNDQIAGFQAYLAGLGSQVSLLVIKVIIFFLALFMFVYQGERLAQEILEHLPERLRSASLQMSHVTVDTLYAIYVVHVATSVVTFILAIPFFYLLGYDHVLFYSVMAAIFQLIPIIGPSLIMIFIAVYALSIGDVRGALLAALIGYPIVCALPDIYFRPVMMGKRARIHPVIMWIGFFGGLAVMGIVGFVLGPLFLTLIVAGYGILINDLQSVRAVEEEQGNKI
jgi:predicted PurR-regulated permease PerM